MRISTFEVDCGAPEDTGIRIGFAVLKLTEEDEPSLFTAKPSKLLPCELTIKLLLFNLNSPARV